MESRKQTREAGASRVGRELDGGFEQQQRDEQEGGRSRDGEGATEVEAAPGGVASGLYCGGQAEADEAGCC